MFMFSVTPTVNVIWSWIKANRLENLDPRLLIFYHAQLSHAKQLSGS